MGVPSVLKLMSLNGIIAIILHYFTELCSLGAICVAAVNIDAVCIVMLGQRIVFSRQLLT